MRARLRWSEHIVLHAHRRPHRRRGHRARRHLPARRSRGLAQQKMEQGTHTHQGGLSHAPGHLAARHLSRAQAAHAKVVADAVTLVTHLAVATTRIDCQAAASPIDHRHVRHLWECAARLCPETEPYTLLSRQTLCAPAMLLRLPSFFGRLPFCTCQPYPPTTLLPAAPTQESLRVITFLTVHAWRVLSMPVTLLSVRL